MRHQKATADSDKCTCHHINSHPCLPLHFYISYIISLARYHPHSSLGDHRRQTAERPLDPSGRDVLRTACQDLQGGLGCERWQRGGGESLAARARAGGQLQVRRERPGFGGRQATLRRQGGVDRRIRAGLHAALPHGARACGRLRLQAAELRRHARQDDGRAGGGGRGGGKEGISFTVTSLQVFVPPVLPANGNAGGGNAGGSNGDGGGHGGPFCTAVPGDFEYFLPFEFCEQRNRARKVLIQFNLCHSNFGN